MPEYRGYRQQFDFTKELFLWQVFCLSQPTKLQSMRPLAESIGRVVAAMGRSLFYRIRGFAYTVQTCVNTHE